MGKTIVIHANELCKENAAQYGKRIEELEAQLAQTSCYEEEFEEGYAVAKKEFIEKACAWLKNEFEGGNYVQDWQLEAFRKAMEK